MRYLLLLLLPVFTACEWSGIEGQNEGVWVEKPMFFGHGGVYGCVEPGKVIHFWTSSISEISRAPQKLKEGFSDIAAKDNVPVDFDAYLTVKLNRCEGEKIITGYGGYQEMYDNVVKDVFRIETRNRVRQQTSVEMRTDTSIIESVQADLLATMKAYAKDNELPISITKVILGKAVPPIEVLTESARTAAERQRGKTMAEKQIAEVARKQSEIARADADNAYRNKLGLSPAEYIKLKEIEMVADKKDAQVIWSTVPTIKTL